MSAKQKLCFFVSGKRFAYEGAPENRLRDLIDFIVKRKVDEADWIAVFRENSADIAEAPTDDAQVIEMIRQCIAAREARKAAKAEQPAAAPVTDQPPPAADPVTVAPPVEQPQPTPVVAPVVVQQPAQPPPPQPQPQPRQQSPPQSVSGTLATSQNTPPEERAALQKFIEEVLTGNENPIVGGVAPAEAPVVSKPLATPSPAQPLPTPGGKITVYLETGPNDPSKIINVGPGMSYDDFQAMVERKCGGKMEMMFTHEDDRIIVDDYDSLELFLNLDVKKHRLLCIPAGTRVPRNEDALTVAGSATFQSGASLEAAMGKVVAAPQEFHREKRTYAGHAAAVYCCSFSPSGDRFATASRDKSVRVWNVETGECVTMQGGHNGFVLSCDFSPNGEHIVSSSDDTMLKLWSSRTGERKQVFKGHSDKVYCAKFNPSGAYIVSGSCDRTVRVWNVDNGSRQATLKGHTMAVFSCGFSRTDNGKFVVSAADDRTVRVWDWRDNREIRTLEGHTGTVWSCEFSHNDKFIVSASMDHEIKLWDVATGQAIRNFPGHMTPIHHAIFTPNDRYILSCARDWTVMVWEVDTGKHVDTLSGHVNTVYHMDVHADKLLTCSLDETVKLWQVTFPERAKQDTDSLLASECLLSIGEVSQIRLNGSEAALLENLGKALTDAT